LLAKPNGNFSSDDRAMLSRVLEEALIVSIDGTELSEPAIKELISRTGKVIMDRFTAGETDPQALKKAAVESIKLSGQKSG
jgi:hypothetical protein